MCDAMVEEHQRKLSDVTRTAEAAAANSGTLEALKSVGRRSPLSNLRDALRGQLRLRIVTAALNWLSKLPRIEWKVESLPDDGGIYRILIKEEK